MVAAAEVIDLGALAQEHRGKARNLLRLAALVMLGIFGIGFLYSMPLSELHARKAELGEQRGAVSGELKTRLSEADRVASVVKVLRDYRDGLESAANAVAKEAADESAACTWALGALMARAARNAGGGRFGDLNLPTAEEVIDQAELHRGVLERYQVIRKPVEDSARQFLPLSLAAEDARALEIPLEPDAAPDELMYPTAELEQLIFRVGGVDPSDYIESIVEAPASAEALRTQFLTNLMVQAKKRLVTAAEKQRASAQRRLDGLDREWQELVEKGIVTGKLPVPVIETPSEDAILESPAGLEGVLLELADTVEAKYRIMEASAAVLGSRLVEQMELVRSRSAELDASIKDLTAHQETLAAGLEKLTIEQQALETSLQETIASLEGQLLPVAILTANPRGLPARVPLLAAGLLFYLWHSARRLDAERARMDRLLEPLGHDERELALGSALLQVLRAPLLVTGLFVAFLLYQAARLPESPAGAPTVVATLLLLLPLIPVPRVQSRVTTTDSRG